MDYDREGRKLTILLDWERSSQFPVATEDDGGQGGLYHPAEMPDHGATSGQVGCVAIDMSKAYVKGVAAHLPQARVSLYPFHVMKFCGDTCNEVRKEVARSVGGLPKVALWSLRGNLRRLPAEAAAQREELCRQYSEIGRAMAMREYLQNSWRHVDVEETREHLDHFCSWA